MQPPDDLDKVGRAAVSSLAALIEELPEESRGRALTHNSWTERRTDSWERPAFLGDSVLGLAIAEELYRRYPRSDIGRLTKIHGQAVSGRACAAVARWLDVPEQLEDARGEVSEGAISIGELTGSERAMASIVEALIGELHLHLGPEPTRVAVLEAFEPQIRLAAETLIDFKSALQEFLARRGEQVKYAITGEFGPAHDRRFEVEARVAGEAVGSGSGTSKKLAEQAAAEAALTSLREG